MHPVAIGLKRYVTRACLAFSSGLTRRRLGGRAGPRDFRRVIIVAACSRRDGIASGARLQFNAMRQLGIDVELLDATRALRNPLSRIRHRPGTVYIFHCGAPQTASLISSVLPHAANAYRIAYWAWELPDPPPDWAGCDRNLSEIWTPSLFSRTSLLKLSRLPIAVVPHHIPLEQARVRDARRPFTVLAMADSRSSLSRKNPEGALRAFHAAFGTSSKARLVLKLGGQPDAWQALEQSAGDLLAGRNVEIVRGFLDQAAMSELYRACDVFLSLHRAEGFGLPMLEAMAHGVPVVATGWSGNLEFMSVTNSHLVSCSLVPVRDISGIYAGSRWAEPDLEQAAVFLRRLADEPDHYARSAAAAYRSIADRTARFPFALQNGTVDCSTEIRPSLMAGD